MGGQSANCDDFWPTASPYEKKILSQMNENDALGVHADIESCPGRR